MNPLLYAWNGQRKIVALPQSQTRGFEARSTDASEYLWAICLSTAHLIPPQTVVLFAVATVDATVRFGRRLPGQVNNETRRKRNECFSWGGGGWPPDIVFDISYRLRIRHDWQTDGDGPGSWTIGE